MAEHLTDNLLLRYRQHALTTEELLRLDDHVQSCAACQQRLTASNETGVRLSALHTGLSFDSEHLTYEELAAYVDRKLNAAARIRADSHLQGCARCTTELDDLRDFSNELKPVSSIPSPSRWRVWWDSMQWRWALPLAAAACLLLVVIWIQRSSVQTPQIAQQSIIQPAVVQETSAPSPGASAAPQVALIAQAPIEGFNELPASQQTLLAAALSNGRLPAVEVSAPSARRETLLGTKLGTKSEEETFALLSPVGQVVLANRPTLRWQPFNEAESYRVTIFTDDYEIVGESPALTATTWTPPQGLLRGRVYLWQVTATKAGREFKAPTAPAPEARFNVLKQSLADGIAAVAHRRTPASELLLGVLYAQAGLFDEAERALQKAARQNPSAAQQLLNDLHVQRRRAMR